ncbi:MAG: hypothetical protein EBS16_06280 [Betaproteobacteria bacterium]|nr:hypothetical protein [Betaproteobacteria bacterium]
MPDRPAALSQSREDRQAVKGVLVLLMLVYHAMSICSQASPEAFRYLRFVTGSFIFLTGWSLGQQWVAQPPDDEGLKKSSARRGTQLLLLFLGLNALILISGWGHPDKQALARQAWPHTFDRLWAALISGHPAAASFGILWPIGWLLISLAALQSCGRRLGRASCATGLTLTACALTGLPWVAQQSGVLDMLLLGWIAMGLAAMWGLRQTPTVRLSSGATGSGLWACTCLAAGLWACAQWPQWLSVYVVAVAFILKGLGDLLGELRTWTSQAKGVVALDAAIRRLGQLSLWAYVMQIVFLQAWRWMMGGERLSLEPAFWVMVFFMALLLWGSCEALAAMRQRLRWVDHAYRWVFP